MFQMQKSLTVTMLTPDKDQHCSVGSDLRETNDN